MTMSLWGRALATVLVLLAFALPRIPALAGPGGALVLDVDATEMPRGIVHVQLRVPASPGRLTLVYPKFLPGTHAPRGPIASLVSLRVEAGAVALAWTRDPYDMYAFTVDVPPGASEIACRYDYVVAPSGDAKSANLGVLSWNAVILYPQGKGLRDVRVAPTLRLPAGWSFATALSTTARDADGARIAFAPVTLETLIDSPVAAGLAVRRFALDSGVEVDAVADDPASLDAPESLIVSWRRLVRESDALWGARHFRHYRFLLTLSDNLAHFGLEHHESSDDRVPERAVIDADLRERTADLLPHEYVHSWNGKFRRPAGLVTPDFQKPYDDELLWVYEGLTNYYGQVLAFRSGMRSSALAADFYAAQAAALDIAPGRRFRSLQDTAVTVAGALPEAAGWGSLRRGVDYYPEGSTMWFDADQVIRAQTGGRRSLDDFARAFAGAPSGAPRVVPYTRSDVVALLQRIAPYRWPEFLRTHVDAIAPVLPRLGFELAGLKLVYDAKPSAWLALQERTRHTVDARYSLGLTVESDGTISEVFEGSPAARAGLGPRMKLLAVDGWKFSADRLRSAIAATARDRKPSLPVVVEQNGDVRVLQVVYRGGARYPHLARVPGRTDGLAAVLAPLARAGAR